MNSWIQDDWYIAVFNKFSNFSDCVALVDEIMATGCRKNVNEACLSVSKVLIARRYMINSRYIPIGLFWETM